MAIKNLIPVAVYARCSTTEQATTSIPDQLKTIHETAKERGYKIVKEYIDEGLSGSRQIEKRVAFHQMIKDSARREFTRILVWNSSRFGRLDSQIGAEYKVQLRKNGVEGIDCVQGRYIDWTTKWGRVEDALSSEADHEYALELSANSIRGRVKMLTERKTLPHSRIPFGYDRIYRGDGQEVRVTRHAPFRKPKTWKRELVVNEEDAKLVRRIFDMFVNRGLSQGHIGRILRDEGVQPHFGKCWNQDTVKKVLTTKCYLGYGVIASDKRGYKGHNRMEPMEVPNVMPRILLGAEGEQLWHDAQRLIAKNIRSSFKSNNPSRALCSILRCGHCGYVLTSKERKRVNGVGTGTYYVCSAGQRGSCDCPQWKANECDILPVIVKGLVKMLDAELLESLTPRDTPTANPVTQIMKEIETLREQVRRATIRAATADDELVAEYEEAVKTLKGQLREVEDKLRQAQHVEAAGGQSLWLDWYREIRPGLVLAADDPTLSEELLEAFGRHPALAKVKGRGGFAEFKKEARKALVRVAADGYTDPLLSIIPELAVGESEGVLFDPSTLRGVLRKLGCEVSIYWIPNPQRRLPTDPHWVPDKGNIRVRWGVVAADDGPDDDGPGGGNANGDVHTAGSGSNSALWWRL